MRTLIALALVAAVVLPARAAMAGGCSGPTVALVDLSPPRAPLPANGNWDAATLADQDRWKAELVAALDAAPGLGHLALARTLTRSEQRALRRLLRGDPAARVPRALRRLPTGAPTTLTSEGRAHTYEAPRWPDTVIVLDVPRDLMQPTTIAVIALYEGRIAAVLHGRALPHSRALIPALVELARETNCRVS